MSSHIVDACLGCGLELPQTEGPVHAYVLTSPGCWETFNRAMLLRGHRLLTDAYMAQHPDGDQPRQRQSPAVHLVTLRAVMDCGQEVGRASVITSTAVDLGRSLGGFRAMSKPKEWSCTVEDVVAGGLSALAYARAVLDDWGPTEGAQIEEWCDLTLDRLYP